MLSSQIKVAIGTNTNTPIRDVYIITETLAVIADSVVKEPTVEPVGGSAIAGIVILCVIFVFAVIAIVCYYYRGSHGYSSEEKEKPSPLSNSAYEKLSHGRHHQRD
jgi:hypothetical protein